MISDRLKRVILRELGLEDVEITGGMLASEVPGWDSLSHTRVITAVEKEYGIRFKGLEVMRLKNVGDLQTLVDRKVAS